jgi:hypothetical protein
VQSGQEGMFWLLLVTNPFSQATRKVRSTQSKFITNLFSVIHMQSQRLTHPIFATNAPSKLLCNLILVIDTQS